MPMDLFEIRNALAQGQSIFDLKLRVTYYARVSTDKDEQLHSLQAQVDYYQEYIQSNPNWTFVEGYIDEGISGTSVDKRESFLQMMDDAKLRKFDFVITKEISRFSRNTVDSIQYTQRLLSYGIGVFFQSDKYNTQLPDAELRQVFQLGVEGTLVVFGNICDFIKEFRIKSDPRLHFVCRHDNTPFQALITV